MKIRVWSLLILISLLIPSLALADDNAQLAQLMQLCNTSQGSFDSYRNEVSVPPVIGGELGRTTFADICDLFTIVYNLNNRVQDLAAKIKLNSTTQTNWQTDLLLGVTIANVASSKYYGEAKPTQPADIEDQKEDQAMKDFYASIGSDDSIHASTYQNTREQAQHMDAFDRAARQKAMLSESLVCPDETGNPDYRTIYEQQIQPLAVERQRYKIKRDHYFADLQELGPTFLRDDAYNKYRDATTKLHDSGVVVRVVDQSATAPYYTKLPAAVPGDPAKVVQSPTAKVKTQTFYSYTDTAAFEKFRADWKLRWKDYVDNTNDVLNRSLDVADNCVGNPPPNTDIFKPRQVNAYAAYNQTCQQNINQKPNTPPAFLFEEILKRYTDNSQLYAAIQAQIWTKESTLLKRPILFDNIQNGSVSLDNSPNCQAEPMSDADQLRTRVKLTETENEFKEIVAQEKVKDGMMRDEELKKQNELAQQQKLKTDFASKQKSSEKTAVDTQMNAPDLGGAF